MGLETAPSAEKAEKAFPESARSSMARIAASPTVSALSLVARGPFLQKSASHTGSSLSCMAIGRAEAD